MVLTVQCTQLGNGRGSGHQSHLGRPHGKWVCWCISKGRGLALSFSNVLRKRPLVQLIHGPAARLWDCPVPTWALHPGPTCGSSLLQGSHSQNRGLSWDTVLSRAAWALAGLGSAPHRMVDISGHGGSWALGSHAVGQVPFRVLDRREKRCAFCLATRQCPRLERALSPPW